MNTRARAILLAFGFFAYLLIARFLLANNPDDTSLAIGFSLQLRTVLLIFSFFLINTFGLTWVLFYRVDRRFFFTGILLPFFVMLSIWGISEELIRIASEAFPQIIAVLVVYAVLAVVYYINILTVNILNAARTKQLPLMQAAKAVHFLLVLISTYLTYTIVLNSGLYFLIKIGVLFAYVVFMTNSSIDNLPLPKNQGNSIVVLISLVQLVATLCITIWPLSSINASVVLTIIYYMQLNLALEMREKITRYIWIEYILLGLLMAVILLANASWGVNGTIF